MNKAELFVLQYETANGAIIGRSADRATMETRFGPMVNREADRGDAFNIAVFDMQGKDVTFDFACFQ